MWKQVAPLFVLAVLIGWFMPTTGDPLATPATQPAQTAPAPAPTATPTPVPQPRKPNLPSMPGDGVVLTKERDGHFYANATANYSGIRMMVDTGASVVALTAADAQRIGLFWNQNELTLVGRGASGDVMGKAVVIDSLSVGNLSARNVRAIIIPNGLDVSLLGQSFLSQVGNVSISGDQMTLRG
jgi:aspartyl protease family protein